jgi:phage terminase small subunit
VAEIKGATRKNPQRYRKETPDVVQPLGKAPDHMSDPAAACWFEISTYAPVGVLKGADRIMLELTSNLLAEYRESPDDFSVGKYTHLIGCLARLGMTPADRQKLGTEKKEADNDFDAF